MTSKSVSITINGVAYEKSVPLRMLLVDFIRDEAGLTGTHIGCTYEGRCGTCTVQVDGEAIKSCMLLAVQVDGREVATVEGLASNGRLHPLQEAFNEHHALQCGFCTPGMLATALELLRENATPSREEVRQRISGNLCRCTGYENIVDAICDPEVAAFAQGEQNV